MTFSSREEAGRELGRHLAERGISPDVVLGLPRGGVVVAAEVAKLLRCPLDVLVVRKIGHPQQREFAVGALAEPDVVLLDRQTGEGQSQAGDSNLQKVIAEETERLRNYQAKFHPRGKTALEGRIVLIVDDGVATGATAEAAAMSARKQKARRIMVASPVASSSAVERLRPLTDEVVALVVDPDLAAVGQYYQAFPQTTDEEVMALIQNYA